MYMRLSLNMGCEWEKERFWSEDTESGKSQ